MSGRLGKDFSTLIPDDMLSDALAVGSNADQVIELSTANIINDPTQPRKHFDDKSLDELAESIKTFGIVQPLIVAKSGKNHIIIAGERRWRAADRIGLKTVPVIVRSFGEQEKLEISLIENIQRQELTLLDLAAAYLKLHDQFSLSYNEVASRVGKSLSAVHNVVRLLKLPLEGKKALHDKKIVEGHARQMVALQNEEDQLKLLELILKNGWTVRQAEQYVVGLKKSREESDNDKASDDGVKRAQSETKETKQLSKRLGATVSVKHMAKGGQLVIRYKDEGHLDTLFKQLLS